MEQWRDAASEQFELLTVRLRELLSEGQLWIRSELGVDLGLDPELMPPWLILLAACSGLGLTLALWASLCRVVFRRQPAVQAVEDSVEVKRAAKPAKTEEQKKKKKKAEKKSQPNGRAVVEPQEEVSEEIVPHHQQPPSQPEKAAEVKKSKKKAKQVAKEPAKTVTTEGKEPEEGTWETKVSNKEKREQRKKDKGSSDGSASPGGGDTPVTAAPEQPKASPVAPPANQKKKKGGEIAIVKAEKVEAVTPKVPNKTEPAAAPVPVAEVKKVPTQPMAPKAAHWANKQEPASIWGSEIDGSWTVIDRNLKTVIGLGVTAAEPQSARWLNQPPVDDQWSGMNGSSNDCNSDWNAPSEVWGNYEEPTPDPAPEVEPSVPEAAKNNLIGAADDDNEKDKEDISADGAAKTKRKKKKKKKATEEGATTGQGDEPEKEVAPVASMKEEPTVQELAAIVQPVKPSAAEVKVERSMKDNTAQKPPVTQVPQKPTDGEPAAKQNNPPAPTVQKKPEESPAAKPAKKKKARRET